MHVEEGGSNETNLSRRLLDGLGSDRDGHQSSGENAVGPDCKVGASTRGRYAAASAYGSACRRTNRQGKSARHWQRQRQGPPAAGRDQVT